MLVASKAEDADTTGNTVRNNSNTHDITRGARCVRLLIRNIFITGATGSDKSYLACALGVEACKRYYSTKYVQIPAIGEDASPLADAIHDRIVYDTYMINIFPRYLHEGDIWSERT